jgi:hypothetical protein
MSKLRRFSQLSPPWQALVRLCQSTNYGQILSLVIRDAEPVFCPPPEVLIDFRLDLDEEPRSETELPDFVLPVEVCRLIDRLDTLRNVVIERVEVRAGVARRVVFKAAPFGEAAMPTAALANVPVVGRAK